ncbi:unnamed protein product [Boreogadus saida]
MADLDRTVRVSGLPTVIEDDRLSDKLLILFLRKKNGGGEIISVAIVEDPRGSALITFEDSRVARRVIQHGQHVLKMDGMQYELTLTPHCEQLKPDMVILSMSVTIDCNQLPLRQIATKVLLEKYPDIKFKYSTEKLCEITGPYSQCETKLGEVDGGLQRLRSARSQISQLHQDIAPMICRVPLLKSTLPIGEVLQRIKDKIGGTHPKLLLNEDDQNIYLIGSYSDTSEAKEVISGYNEARGVSDQMGGLLRATSLDFNSAYPYEGPPVVHQPIPGSLCCKTDTMLGPDKDENRAEGATKYKLAAQFKYTEPGLLVSQPADLTGAGLRLSPAMLGPQLVPDVLSCTARLTDKGLSRQNTGEDVLSENGIRPSQSSTSGDYERKFSKSPQIQTLISPSGSVTRPALGAGLGFNYESSSSETSAPKVQTDRRSDDEEPQGCAKYRVRERTDSFSDLKDKARLLVH